MGPGEGTGTERLRHLRKISWVVVCEVDQSRKETCDGGHSEGFAGCSDNKVRIMCRSSQVQRPRKREWTG